MLHLKSLIITILLIFIMGMGTVVADIPSPNRPNILWVFSDDHAFQAIGAYGGRFKDLNITPHLDSIAKDGMRFDRCYVGNSICAPSRATLLTGKHSHKNGKLDNYDSFDQNQQQFQKLLQKSDYQTAMIGKIHLPGKMQGFDYWEVLPGQGRYHNPDFISEKGKTVYKGHSTDVITDRALHWLKNKRDPSKPFMTMVHYKAPHRGWQPADRFKKKFRSMTFPEPDTLHDDYRGRGSAAANTKMTILDHMHGGDLKLGDIPKRRKQLQAKELSEKERRSLKYQMYMQDYMACIAGIDENIGRLLAYLKESGLEKNTIIMYAADQGFYLGEHGWYDKRFMYEESFRTPLLAKWPGVIPAGTVNRDLVQNIDFAETFLDLADTPIPTDMQGKSIVPLLKGTTPNNWRQAIYYHFYEYPGEHRVRRHEGATTQRYKLIRFYGYDVPNREEWELYDLKNDPNEMRNEAQNPEYAKVLEQMKGHLIELKKQYDVTEVPQIKPTYGQKGSKMK
jgi:arylsulfatase A-like enzyme